MATLNEIRNRGLTEEQKIMLAMSEDDIQNGKMIDQDSLNMQELQWLKEK